MSDPYSSNMAYVIFIIIFILILASSVVACLDTIEIFKNSETWMRVSLYLEAVFVICFTIEFVVKLMAAPDAIKFIMGPLNVLDLLAILPWYLNIIFSHIQSNLVPILRVFRLVILLFLNLW